MATNDSRRQRLSVTTPVDRVAGLSPVVMGSGLSATAIMLILMPGVIVIGDHTAYYQGGEPVQFLADATLAEGESVWGSVVCYWNPLVGRVFVRTVTAAPATAGSEARVTDAEIESALADIEGVEWFRRFDVRFNRPAAAVTVNITAIDPRVAPQDVEPDRKFDGGSVALDLTEVSSTSVPVPPRAISEVLFGFTIDAADIANGDAFPGDGLFGAEGIGQITGWQAVVEKALDAGGDITVALELNGAAVAGWSHNIAGAQPIGTLIELTDSGSNVYLPAGSQYQLVFSGVTGYSTGRIRFEIRGMVYDLSRLFG